MIVERTFTHGNDLLHVSGSRQGEVVRIETEGGPREFAWEELGPGDYLLRAGAEQIRCVVARAGEERWLWIGGRVHHLRVATERGRREHAPGAGSLVAPMPGQVLQVLVQPGQRVARNETLVVLEAMKMRFEITAPHDGRVSAVSVTAGAQVAGGAPLVAIEAEDAS